jgi:hypothetical protein
MNTSPEKVNCACVRENFALFTDGLLEEGAAHELRAHLSQCVECNAWLDEDLVLDQELARVAVPERVSRFSWWRTGLTAMTASAAAVFITLHWFKPEPISVPQGSEESVALREVGVGSFDDVSREELETEVGRLLSENASLRLLAGAAGRASSESVDAASLVQAVAVESGRAMDGSRDGWRCVRAAGRALAGREAAAVRPIEEQLLAAKSSPAARIAGLRLHTVMRLPHSARRVKPFLEDRSVDVRREAVEALGACGDPEARPMLEAVFHARESDEALRISAAGGLVRHGVHEEPLRYLAEVHDRPGQDARTRADVLARILRAPLAQSDKFLLGVLVSSTTDTATREAVVEMLVCMNSERAEAILDFAELAPVDAALKELVCQQRAR